jgi:hypothetical protein
MVNVGVAQDEDIYFGRLKHEVQVPFIGFLPLALKQPAFKQDFFIVDGNKHLRPGNGLCRAAELDGHICTSGHGRLLFGVLEFQILIVQQSVPLLLL